MADIDRDPQGVSDIVVGLVDQFSKPYGIRQTANQPQVMLGDAAGNLIGTPTGESGDIALAVHVEHLHQTPWLHPFTSPSDPLIQDTLNGAVAVNSKALVVDDVTGFVVGDCVNISPPGEHAHVYREIKVIAASTLTVDAGLDDGAVDASVITVVLTNMAVNGSVTPVIFKATPGTDARIDIMRLLFFISSSTAPDDSKFGNIATLTNGVHIRKNIGNGTSYLTLGIWKKNGDMKLTMYNVDYSTKAGGGNHGTNGRWTIFESGAVLNIDDASNETVEFVIQDDLSSLVEFNANVQGHPEI